MSVQKPLKLDADAFCVSYASLPDLNRLSDMNGNCMSSSPLRLGNVTTEKPRPLAYQGFPAFTVSENAQTEKPTRKKKEATPA